MKALKTSWLFACLLSACAGDGGTVCDGVICDRPPADRCLDSRTIRTYTGQGSCDPRDGTCNYTYTDAACDRAPENTCLDETTLRIYAAEGHCDPPGPACSYDWTDRLCEQGCSEGRCTDEDLCQGVICDQPPAPVCRDEGTLERHAEAGQCDPATGLCSYEAELVDCQDGCFQGICADLAGGCGLLLPAGTRVCSDKTSTWDLFGTYLHRMRIAFAEGLVQLPADEDRFGRDWIAAIELGPEKTLLEPLNEGGFAHSADGAQHSYSFEQDFTDGERLVCLRYEIAFPTGSSRLRVFDELYLSPNTGLGTIVQDLTVSSDQDEHWIFTTCRHALYSPVLHLVSTADGGELALEERCYLDSWACMLACPTALRRADCAWGEEQRRIDDPFRLAFVDGQHNWSDKFLVVFDAPVSERFAVYYYPEDRDTPEPVVHYLDANLEEIGSSLVTGHETVELSFVFDARSSPAATCGEYCRDVLGLAVDCRSSCPLGGRSLAGRCMASQTQTGEDWTAIEDCDQALAGCADAGRPFVQCCCQRYGA
ncbi:MAG: hypothetical protein JXR96_15570 [Deltaproteobacteria bacterium]|nr:hypothetical protein [Deltaproteobacteria bacterium]